MLLLINSCILLEKEQWLEFVSLNQQKRWENIYLKLDLVLNDVPDFLSVRSLKNASLTIQFSWQKWVNLAKIGLLLEETVLETMDTWCSDLLSLQHAAGTCGWLGSSKTQINTITCCTYILHWYNGFDEVWGNEKIKLFPHWGNFHCLHWLWPHQNLL